MESKLGEFIRAERCKRGLSLGAMTRLVGYRNVSKGARRIIALEQTGTAKPDLLVHVAEALDLDWIVVEQMMEDDHLERLREWERWVSEPVPMCLVIRLMAAVYTRKVLPADITALEAEALACKFAREHRLRVCLVLSRRQSVWIDTYGEIEAKTEAKPDSPNAPFMEVKGKRFLLDWNVPRVTSRRYGTAF